MATTVQNPPPTLKGAVGAYKELQTERYERERELDEQSQFGAVKYPK